MNDYHCFQTIQNSFDFDSTELFSCCSFVHDESNFLQILVYIDEDQRTVQLQQKEESKIKELQRKKNMFYSLCVTWKNKEKLRQTSTDTNTTNQKKIHNYNANCRNIGHENRFA